MKITRNTMRADGMTVGEARDRDAAFLRSMGIPAKDGTKTYDELEEDFIMKTRDAVLDALDNVTPTGKGWTDSYLPTLFPVIDAHAISLFWELYSTGQIKQDDTPKPEPRGKFYLFTNGIYRGEFDTMELAVLKAYALNNVAANDLLNNKIEGYHAWMQTDDKMQNVEVMHEDNYRFAQGNHHPANRMDLKEGYDKFIDDEFTIDGETNYKGKHNPDVRWNGFACPYFTFEVAKKIAEDMNYTFEYNEDRDMITMTYRACDDDVTEYFGQLFEGVRMYAIGAWDWVWSEKETEERTEEPKDHAHTCTKCGSHRTFLFDNESLQRREVGKFDNEIYADWECSVCGEQGRIVGAIDWEKRTQEPQIDYAAKFPNGFTSWIETHHQIVAAIAHACNGSGTPANVRANQQGMGGLWEMGEELTDRFENEHKGEDWEDGKWFDIIDTFCDVHVYGRKG